MSNRARFWMVLTSVLLLAVVAAMLLDACGGLLAPAPVVCATYQAPDGTWMEQDNEEVDDDPCDTGVDLPHVKPTTKKPVPKASPTKKRSGFR